MANADQILLNLDKSLGPILDFVSGAGYVAGVMMVAMGLFKLRKVGDYRSMMYQPVDFFPPMIMIVAGVLLMMLPGIFKATTYTIFTASDNLLSFQGVTTQGFQSYQVVIIHMLQIVGVASFIRGLILIGKSGNANAGPGGGNKGMVHIVGGVLCYHIYPFYNVVYKTLLG